MPVSIADGEEIFAIGDVHGRVDLLRSALGSIRGEERRAAFRRVVFLGDLIDRGPDSLGVLDAALTAKEAAGADDVIWLMGNHETMLRQTLEASLSPVHRAIALRCWLSNGGRDTLDELHDDGLKRALVEHQIGDDGAVLRRLGHAFGAERLGLLARMGIHHRSGGVVFVHAGLPPNLSIEKAVAASWTDRFDVLNENEHWAWVRSPFLTKHHKRCNAAPVYRSRPHAARQRPDQRLRPTDRGDAAEPRFHAGRNREAGRRAPGWRSDRGDGLTL